MSERFFMDHGLVHDRVTGRHVCAPMETDSQENLLKVLELLESGVRASAVEQLRQLLAELADIAREASGAMCALDKASRGEYMEQVALRAELLLRQMPKDTPT